MTDSHIDYRGLRACSVGEIVHPALGAILLVFFSSTVLVTFNDTPAQNLS